MTIEFTEEPMTALSEYARVPIVFTVDHVLDVTNRDDGPGGFALSERRRRSTPRLQLKIETQNTNVRACRFYERQGCQLRAIHRAAYPELPEEIQLLWYKDLSR